MNCDISACAIKDSLMSLWVVLAILLIVLIVIVIVKCCRRANKVVEPMTIVDWQGDVYIINIDRSVAVTAVGL